MVKTALEQLRARILSNRLAQTKNPLHGPSRFHQLQQRASSPGSSSSRRPAGLRRRGGRLQRRPRRFQQPPRPVPRRPQRPSLSRSAKENPEEKFNPTAVGYNPARYASQYSGGGASQQASYGSYDYDYSDQNFGNAVYGDYAEQQQQSAYANSDYNDYVAKQQPQEQQQSSVRSYRPSSSVGSRGSSRVVSRGGSRVPQSRSSGRSQPAAGPLGQQFDPMEPTTHAPPENPKGRRKSKAARTSNLKDDKLPPQKPVKFSSTMDLDAFMKAAKQAGKLAMANKANDESEMNSVSKSPKPTVSTATQKTSELAEPLLKTDDSYSDQTESPNEKEEISGDINSNDYSANFYEFRDEKKQSIKYVNMNISSTQAQTTTPAEESTTIYSTTTTASTEPPIEIHQDPYSLTTLPDPSLAEPPALDTMYYAPVGRGDHQDRYSQDSHTHDNRIQIQSVGAVHPVGAGVTPPDPLVQTVNNAIQQQQSLGPGPMSVSSAPYVTEANPIVSMMLGMGHSSVTQGTVVHTPVPDIPKESLPVTPKSTKKFKGYPAPRGPFENGGTPGPKQIPYKWIAYPGYSISGSILGEPVASGDECFQRCIERGPQQCVAVDFDSKAGACWFHSTDTACNVLEVTDYIYHAKVAKCGEQEKLLLSAGEGTTQNVIHVPANFSAPKGYFQEGPFPGPTILPTKWLAYPGYSVSGAKVGEPAKSGDACFQRCIDKGPDDCIAVDYDSNSGSCWFHTKLSACRPLIISRHIYHVKLAYCPNYKPPLGVAP